jgi:hypothetical protein
MKEKKDVDGILQRSNTRTAEVPRHAGLENYTAVMYDEDVQEMPEPHCDNLHRYRSVMENEPVLAEENPATKYGDLGKHTAVKAHELDGKHAAVEKERPIDDLNKYRAFRCREPDGKPADYDETSAVDQAELNKYQAFRYNEPDGKRPPKTDKGDPAELQKYSRAVRYTEPHGRPPLDYTEPSTDPGELENYQPFRYNEPDVKSPLPTEKESDRPAELSEYKAVGHNGPDGKPVETRDPVAQSSEEFDERVGASYQCLETSSEQEIERLVREQVDGVSFDGTNKLQQRTLDRPEASQSSLSQPARPKVEADSYIRKPQGNKTSYVEERGGESSRPTSVRTYGNPKAESDDVAPHTTAQNTDSDMLSRVPGGIGLGKTLPEPTVYKILAYDPTMQTINIAETSSVVADSNPPLTPAEVLLRLSNPTKFFPHFGPLRTQGFEIVSGSGDVLVFRKVHPVVAESGEPSPISPEAAKARTGPATITQPVNPIDMTGGRPIMLSPASGNFASPTGFVNYDHPSLGHCPPTDPPPRFVSSINVRREEPVFSGPKSSQQEQPKKSIAKRLVTGAVWVAVVSYALGVVGEYFKTGGADSGGPSGF